MNNLVSTKEMNNGTEIGQSIDEDRREMETGKFQPDPQFRIDDNGREILTPLPGSDSLGSLNSSEIGRSIFLASDFLRSLNGPEIGQSIDENGREMETGTNILTPAVSSTSLPRVRLEGSSISSRLFPNYLSAFERLLSLSSNYLSAFAEIREKTPMPKEQETRTKPPLARKKENGVRQYRGVRQRRGGKFGAEIRDSSQKGGKRWLRNFNSAEEAAHAYDRAAYEMRGSMARLNFPLSPLPHPSIWAISESSASKQQHDDLEINPVKLASRFAHWPSDSHHSIHPMIIAPHVPAILSQATSLHAHQHKGGKRREISFQDMHPEVQGEMEK